MKNNRRRGLRGGAGGDVATAYRAAMREIEQAGGLPILFQCSEFKRMLPNELISFYRALGASCEKFLLFELGEMFAPFGSIYPLETVRELMQIPQIVGMKHSSLERELEWQRLALRAEVRPEFKVYTGTISRSIWSYMAAITCSAYLRFPRKPSPRATGFGRTVIRAFTS